MFSDFFNRRVNPQFQFLYTKREGNNNNNNNNPTGTLLTGATNAMGYKKSRFPTNVWLYLGIDA